MLHPRITKPSWLHADAHWQHIQVTSPPTVTMVVEVFWPLDGLNASDRHNVTCEDGATLGDLNRVVKPLVWRNAPRGPVKEEVTYVGEGSVCTGRSGVVGIRGAKNE